MSMLGEQIKELREGAKVYDNMTAESVVSDKRVDANDGRMAQADSREKLLDYIWREITTTLTNNGRLYDPNFWYANIVSWLDRQAAITAAESYKLADDSRPQVITSAEEYELAYSRERLEADALDYVVRMAKLCHGMGLRRELWQFNPEPLHMHIRQCLDRQAAITERECMTAAGLAATKAPALQAEVDNLTAERDQLSRDLEAEHALAMQLQDDTDRLRAELAEVKAECDELDEMRERYARALNQIADALGVEITDDAETHAREMAAIEKLKAERDEMRDIIDHMPKTEAECEACQEVHDRLMFNAKLHQDELRDKLREKQHVCDVQRDSFKKLERELKEAKNETD